MSQITDSSAASPQGDAPGAAPAPREERVRTVTSGGASVTTTGSPSPELVEAVDDLSASLWSVEVAKVRRERPDGLPERVFNLAAIWDAYEAGARDARAHHPAGDALIARAADAYCKSVWDSAIRTAAGFPSPGEETGPTEQTETDPDREAVRAPTEEQPEISRVEADVVQEYGASYLDYVRTEIALELAAASHRGPLADLAEYEAYTAAVRRQDDARDALVTLARTSIPAGATAGKATGTPTSRPPLRLIVSGDSTEIQSAPVPSRDGASVVTDEEVEA